MTPLRARMIHQMQLHRLSPGTQDNYVRAIEGLARFHGRSPDQLTAEQLRAYLHHLLVERKLAWSTCNVIAAAIRFFVMVAHD